MFGAFDDVAYNTPVQILRSELALAERKAISAVDIKTAAGKNVTYTDMSNAGEGVMFTMPDSTVDVYIYIDDIKTNVPTVIIDNQVKHGHFVYRRSAKATDPAVDILDFDPGETVYVFDVPDSGYDHLGIGDLKIYVNGMQNAVNIEKVNAEPHIWSFVMREGTIIMKADFPLEDADTVAITVKVVDINGKTFKTGKVEVVTGGSINTITGSGTFNALEGQTIEFLSDTDGYTVYRVQSASGKGVTGSTYVVPELSEATPALQDTLTVTLAVASNPIKWSATGGKLEFSTASYDNAVSADTGATVTIDAYKNTGYNALKTVDLKVVSIETGNEVAVKEVGTKWTFTMPAGGVNVTATFKTNAQVEVHFIADNFPAGAKAKLAIAGLGNAYIDNTHDSSSPMTYYFAPGTVITVTPDTAGFESVTLRANKGVISGNTYTVPYDDGTTVVPELTIALKLADNPIKWNAVGGTFDFTNSTQGLNNVVSGNVGDIILITATADSGNKPLAVDKIRVTRLSDNQVIVLNQTSAANADPSTWTFTMPAGGVKVEAIFESDNQVPVSFESNTNVSLQIDGLGKKEDTFVAATPYYYIAAGTSVTVTPGTDSGCNRVRVTDNNGFDKSGASVVYTVPSSAVAVTIEAYSTATPVKLNTVKHGSVFLRKTAQNTDPSYQPSEFAEDDQIYFEIIPETGYILSKFEVEKNADKTKMAIQDSTVNPSYKVMTDNHSKIPYGGITITAEFEPVPVTVTFNVMVNGAAASGTDLVAIANGINILAGGTNASYDFDSTVTVNLESGYSWDGTPITVTSGNIKAPTSNSFSVTDASGITLTLNLKK